MDSHRRRARRITREDESDTEMTNSEPVVKKPSSKPKRKPGLGLSFGAGDNEPEVVTSKKLGARQLEPRENSIPRSSLSTNKLPQQLPIRAGQDEDRPSYNKEVLQALRNSTPSTPKNIPVPAGEEDEAERSLDIAGKFGELVNVSTQQSAIPSEAAIREKKARRARLAKEQEYISLNGTESEEEEGSSLMPWKAKEAETRLVRDDEDFAEGFDEFVEDGRISLGKNAELEQRRRHRAEMKDLIDEAEDKSDEDASETERQARYENMQARAGLEGMNKQHLQEPVRTKTPPKITSLPTLASTLSQLRSTINMAEGSKSQLLNRLDELRTEKIEISTREVEIQKLLKEAGDNYEKLRTEAGLNATAENLIQGAETEPDRGLENISSASFLGSSGAIPDGG